MGCSVSESSYIYHSVKVKVTFTGLCSTINCILPYFHRETFTWELCLPHGFRAFRHLYNPPLKEGLWLGGEKSEGGQVMSPWWSHFQEPQKVRGPIQGRPCPSHHHGPVMFAGILGGTARRLLYLVLCSGNLSDSFLLSSPLCGRGGGDDESQIESLSILC